VKDDQDSFIGLEQPTAQEIAEMRNAVVKAGPV
jgi:hypothetical protein